MFNIFKSKKKQKQPEHSGQTEETLENNGTADGAETNDRLPQPSQSDSVQSEQLTSSPDSIADSGSHSQNKTSQLSFAGKIRLGLTRTRQNLGRQLSGLFGAGGKIDEDLYEELETILLTADTGVKATAQLLEDLRLHVKKQSLTEAADLKTALKESLVDMLKALERPLDTTLNKPFVIMITGVNGVGKTTSIGKLAKYFQAQGQSVLLAAGDTFRAAAREQLIAWGERNDVTVIAPDSDPGKKSDPAAVIFDAINAAKARGIDIVLADTAGRLTTQLHLMEEIKKVKRVIAKAMPDAPHEVLLVLDANTGQNAVTQVQAFDQALDVTGLILTKLDGTAKGGVVAAIRGQYPQNPPALRFIGVGEGVDDLRPFNAEEFVDAMID
ncbi:fused signal recognition particle receptor [Nitrosomonas sp. Nm51]|uniref:signal recognition particle-docking protein FtsY n=1 Tax=Nitrosomonas sp. Nm51 TaxID=133720 RepID=UPI0008B4574B|nr:signal recognition particle-docking protein FtsY [Nitrosomonas sp. Nm51]SER50180.1 fused signal recognition particle receptor [Nitrosomonas sp. Nm51]